MVMRLRVKPAMTQICMLDAMMQCYIASNAAITRSGTKNLTIYRHFKKKLLYLWHL
jgi:hypothetical protein